MIPFQHIAALLIVCIGGFFLLVGSLGVVRLPDFYSRTHAATKSDTLGIMLVLGGLVIYEGFTENSIKLIVAIIFVALANPVGSHALAKAAFRYGLEPWFAPKKESRGTRQEQTAEPAKEEMPKGATRRRKGKR